MMRIRNIAAVLTTLIVASATSAAAQSPTSTDARWGAWLGCWQLVEERAREEWEPEPSTREFVAARGAAVCVTPGDQPNAVRLTTRVESQSTLEDSIVADGAQHPLREPGCAGTQRAEWSSNGLRLFARTEVTCG